MNYKTKEELIAFESRIKDAWEAGDLPYLLHLSGGNEDELIRIFDGIQEGDWIFGTHRSHYHALLCGMSEERVEAAIHRGDSMFLFSRKHRFLTSSILAGMCCIAVGVAKAIKDAGGTEWCYCFIGDGGEDQGHCHEAFMYSEGHHLPVTFIIEDNGIQVDTPKQERRGARFLYDTGCKKCEDPFMLVEHIDPLWPSCVQRYNFTRNFPHAGSGCAHKIVFKDKKQ